MFSLSRDVVLSLVALLLKIVAGGLGYLMVLFASRVLGPEEYGQFTVLFSIAMLLSLFSNFGQSNFFIKQFSIEQHSPAMGMQSLYRFVNVTSILGACSGVLLWLLYLYISNNLSVINLVSGGGFISIYSMSLTAMGAMRSFGMPNYAIFLRDIVWRITVILSLFVVSLLGVGLSASSVLLVVFIGMLLPFFLQVISLFSKGVFVAGKVQGLSGVNWMSTSVGLTAIGVVSAADGYVFNIATSYFLGDFEAGAVFASVKTVEVVSIFMMAVTLVMAKDFSMCLAKKDTLGLQRKLNVAIFLQILPVIFCFVFIVVFSQDILIAFDPQYVRYWPFLIVMAIAMLVNSITGSTVSLMQLGGLHWHHLFLQSTAIFLGLISMFYFVPAYGIDGVAYAYLLNKIIWNFSALYVIRRNLGVDPSIFSLVFNVNRVNSYLFYDITKVSGNR